MDDCLMALQTSKQEAVLSTLKEVDRHDTIHLGRSTKYTEEIYLINRLDMHDACVHEYHLKFNLCFDTQLLSKCQRQNVSQMFLFLALLFY